MPSYEKIVRKTISASGGYFTRQGKGSHEIWYSPLTNTSISVPTKIKSKATANKILKDSGLPKLP
jgi:predicted RNA binding protein YcfA (HicA-like mRNA interferase family)